MYFLEPHLNLLKELAKKKTPEQQQLFVLNCPPEDIRLLVEICFNLLKGNIHLTPSQKSHLTQFASSIRKFSRQRSAPSARKIVQEGQGLPLAAIASIVLSELANFALK